MKDKYESPSTQKTLTEIFREIQPKGILCNTITDEEVERSIPKGEPLAEDETGGKMVSYSNRIFPEKNLGSFSTSQGSGSITLRKVKRTLSYSDKAEEKNEDFYIFGCSLNGNIIANLRFIHSSENNTWDLVDRVVEPEFRGGGIGTEFLQMAELCIQEYADKTQAPQHLTASNVGQAGVMRFLEKNGWKPSVGNEDRHKRALNKNDPDLVTRSDERRIPKKLPGGKLKSIGHQIMDTRKLLSPIIETELSNPDAQNWIYDRKFLEEFEAQHGDIFLVDALKRPYIYKAFLVPFEKTLTPRQDEIGDITAETRESFKL
ncbi:MAG: GNAT family N-acetyltransferase [Candidatus Peregrinibacteria bacterium]